MNLKQFSDDQLLSSLKRLKETEIQATLSILYHLIEIEDRGLYRDAGYSSLFDYCTRCLGYSEGSAARRVSGARCLRENPELADLLLRGQVTLCTITTAARSIQAKTTKVEEIVGKSKREVQILVTPAVESKPKEIVRPVVVKAMKATTCTAQTPEKSREERYEIRFSVTKEVYEEFQEARAELSNELRSDLSVEAVFERLLKARRKTPTRTRTISKVKNTRCIPTATKRDVRKRDGNQCSYVAPDGTQCSEKHFLQFDHIMPFALGGRSEFDNLRLLCPAHNKLEAERSFTKTFIHSKIHSTGGAVVKKKSPCTEK